MSLNFIITDAGMDAIADAEGGGTDAVTIAELGLTDTAFDAAPTIIALPGEHTRLDTLSGQVVAPNKIHLSAYDTSDAVYTVTGMALYLADGTLFAVYSGPAPALSKSALAFGLFSIDIAFLADVADVIEFGGALFLYPPATEEIRGVARLATQARVDAVADGADDAETIVTPKTLRARLAALWTSITAAIMAEATTRANADTALAAHTVTGGGLITGGGALSTNPTLTVAECSAAQLTAGTATDVVVTPRRLGPIAMSLNQNGYIRFFGFQIAWGRFTAAANGTTAVNFATPFATACFSVVCSGSNGSGNDTQDNGPGVVTGTITTAGFSVWSAEDNAIPSAFIAVGT